MKQTTRNFPENRKKPFRQIQRAIVTKVDYIVGHVAREGWRVGIPTPLCRKIVEMLHELETGKGNFMWRITLILRVDWLRKPYGAKSGFIA